MAFIDRNANRIAPRGSTEVDQLLAAAISQGGAVGEAAERLANPKKAFFATMTERTAGALDKFVSVIQTPLYGIAGLLDPDMTMAEAISKRQTPGDVLLTRPGSNASTAEKAGYQTMKFAFDTLLDPLTYLTFGASKGVAGLSKGTQFIANGAAAERAGVKEGMYAYLTKEGDEAANKLYQSYLKGLRNTYLKNERIKMVGKGMSEEDIVKNLKQIDDTVSDSLIKEALNSSVDKQWAANTVGNMLAKYPHLTKEWVDRGGMKFFGKTLLSAQRTQVIGAAIPGMSQLDKVVSPIRGFFGNAFSTKYSGGIRLTDEFIEHQQKYKMIEQSRTGHIIRDGMRVKKQLQLSDQEWEFVTAAIEHGLKPRDPRAADVWNVLHKQPPTNGTIREEVWRGILSVEKMLSASRDSMIKSGMKVSDKDGYIPHLVIKEDISDIPFKARGIKQTTDRSKFAKYSVLVDDDGMRMPVMFSGAPNKEGMVSGKMLKDGATVETTFKVINSGKEIERIQKIAKEKVDSISKSIEESANAIKAGKEKIGAKISSDFTSTVLERLALTPGITKADIEAIGKAASKVIDDSSIDKIVNKRMSRFYKQGVKISAGSSVKEINLDKLAMDIVTAKSDSTEIARRINKLLAESPKLPHAKTMKPKPKVEVDKEVMKLAKQMKEEADAIRAKTIERKVDPKGIEDLITQIVARTSKNPAGLIKIIDNIIENKQLAAELKEELADVTKSVALNTDEVLEQAGKFMTDAGKYLNRKRATIQEAEQFGLAKFEKNALAIALMHSEDIIRTTTAKDFVKATAEKFGKRASQAEPGWVPVETLGFKHENIDLAKWLTADNGEELLFHPSVAKEIAEFTKGMTSDAATNDIMKIYDGLQNYFKAAVTSFWPAFHGRNAVSNVFLMYNKIGVEALNPVNHVASANFMNMQRKAHALQRAMIGSDESADEYAKLMTQTVFTDKTGYKWSFGEMRTQLMDNVVSFHPRNVGQTDQMRFGVKQVHEAKKLMFPSGKGEKAMAKFNSPANPFSSENYLFKGGYFIGQQVEDYSRTLTFMAQLRATGDPIQAAQVTKQALFDYVNLTNFEKTVMRRILPFYTFTRKNLELQVSTLLSNPGKIAQEIRAVQSIGDAFRGEELSEEEMKALPDWAKEGYNVVSSREGSHITLLKTLGTPLEELFSRTSGHANIASISPLIKLPLELGNDYSFFHGRPISKVTQADAYQFAPEYIKDFIGYEEVKYKGTDGKTHSFHTSFNPDNMYLINNLQPAGRFFSEVNRIENTPEGKARLMTLFFGFGVREFDVQVEQEKRIKERKEELEALLSQAGLGYQFTRFVQKKPQDIVEY